MVINGVMVMGPPISGRKLMGYTGVMDPRIPWGYKL